MKCWALSSKEPALSGTFIEEEHAFFAQALHYAPNSAVLYANRAAAYLKRGWISDSWAALQDCEKAVSLDPLFAKAHCRRVHALISLGQVTAFRRAVRLLPRPCAHWRRLKVSCSETVRLFSV